MGYQYIYAKHTNTQTHKHTNTQTLKTKIFQFIEDHEAFFNSWEAAFKAPAPYPHYKYAIIPFYKAMGGNQSPALSVPMTFLITDYLFHQLTAKFLFNLYDRDEMSFFPIIGVSLAWTSLCIPIVLYKQYKLEKQQEWAPPNNTLKFSSLETPPKHKYKFSLFAQQACDIDDQAMLKSCFGKRIAERMKR